MSTEQQVEAKRTAQREQLTEQAQTKDFSVQRDAVSAFRLAHVQPRSMHPAAILALQRTAGNAAVNRLLAQQAAPGSSGHANGAGLGWGALLSVQREITDKAEQEALSGYFGNQLKELSLSGDFYLTGKVLPYVLKSTDKVDAAERAIKTQLGYLSELSRVTVEDVKPNDFATAGEAREADFVKLAAGKGITTDVAKELYQAARSDVKADTVTGFDLAGDRKPTVERALAYIKEHPTTGAYYVEVDVKNLGGLNSTLGHQKADAVYGQMARIAEEKMMSLPAKVGRFRHGGDEFSFVVVGKYVTKTMIDITLADAGSAIAAYVEEQKLAGIGHPKYPTDESKQGTGIVYGISIMSRDDNVDTVLSGADQQVEAKKKTTRAQPAEQVQKKGFSVQRDAVQPAPADPRAMHQDGSRALQHAAGNAAVNRRLSQQAASESSDHANEAGQGRGASLSVQREITDKAEREALSGYFGNQLKELGLAGDSYLTGKVLPYIFKTQNTVDAAERAIKTQLGYLSELSRVTVEDVKPQDFATAGEAREADFVKLAAGKGITTDAARELYQAARSDVKADTVTGFDLAGDRKPTVERALAYIKEHPTTGAYYGEVDVKNLGGLNSTLGHQKADAVYGQMARIAEEKMMSLPAKVGRFRHGGDEFSFVVVGKFVTKTMIDITLTDAGSAIAAYVKDQKLADIVHPKYPTDESKQGTGIVYGISIMSRDDNVDTVLSAADQQVEAKKKS